MKVCNIHQHNNINFIVHIFCIQLQHHLSAKNTDGDNYRPSNSVIVALALLTDIVGDAELSTCILMSLILRFFLVGGFCTRDRSPRSITTSDMVGLIETGDWVHISAISIIFHISSSLYSIGSSVSSTNFMCMRDS
ncbi:hypothetical protein HanPSC8_Chr14g0618571 [Helianthus annuus]|nr:hypothetical protein HanPSC8_Chr14g0618571 [Helianthus annuus]